MFGHLALALLMLNLGLGAFADQGTPQLAGDNGELGKVYSIRKESPLYFCLKSAEFTTAQVTIGDALYVPKADEKLLVLHFTVQNPQHEETIARGDSLRLTVVDAVDVNHQAIEDWGDAQNHGSLNIGLKPAQKIEAYAVVSVPAKGPIPKLMVQPPTDDDGPILRYDLRGKVTGLKPPVADPADTTGATALTEVLAALNVAYPFEHFVVTVEKYEYTTAALDADAPEDGGRYLVVTLLTKNVDPGERVLRFDTFTPALTSTDGEQLQYQNTLLLATANRAFDQQVKPGAETRVRLYFTVPKGTTPKTLELKEDESRAYQYDVSK